MIQISNLSKSFNVDRRDVKALDDVTIEIEDGDIYGVIGMSGAGKSTLVRCINMLEKPTSGTVIVDGVDLAKLSIKELRTERREISMIFQNFNLLMQQTCIENVCFPMHLIGYKKDEMKARAHELLKLVGIDDKASAYPSQLSGGQRQRVAIARALATNPKVLLCDEATSALDPKTTNQILELIKDIHEQMGITVIFITHEMAVVEKICKKVAILDGGKVVEKGYVSEIFANPKSQAAKRLVFPDRAEQAATAMKDGYKIISVAFNDAEATDSPLIAKLALEKDVEASIIYAATRSIDGKMFGKMLLSIQDKDDNVDKTLAFFGEVNGIIASVEEESSLQREVV